MNSEVWPSDETDAELLEEWSAGHAKLRQITSALDNVVENLNRLINIMDLRDIGLDDRSLKPAPPAIWVDDTKPPDHLLTRIEKQIGVINNAVGERAWGFPEAHRLGGHPVKERWRVGTLRHSMGGREVLRGRLLFCRDVPLAHPLPLATLLFFKQIAIPGLSDELVLENHDHFGYHYHYSVKGMGRSDTILSFGNADGITRLKNESHAVNKALAKARPNAWKDRKRMSIYEVCLPDLSNKGLKNFKIQSKNASNVWPI